MRDPLRVYYDAECPLCSALMAWARERDRAGELCPVPAASEAAAAELGVERRMRLEEELHAWSEAEGMIAGPEAVASLLARLPGWRWAGRLLLLRPALTVARPIYRAIARRRRAVPRPGGATVSAS